MSQKICNNFFASGINVITTGNHVWDNKEIMDYIEMKVDYWRPKNLFEPAPGRGFAVYLTKGDLRIGVLNLMGNVFMKKCEDVFLEAKKIHRKIRIEKYDNKVDFQV